MAFIIMHRTGVQEDSSDLGAIGSLLTELDGEDPEHPDVAVSTADGWTVSAFHSGLVVFENVETGGGAQHQRNLSRSQAQEIMTMLAGGNLEQVQALAWLPGYG